MKPLRLLREEARAIWQAGVDAVRPEGLVRSAVEDPGLGLRREVELARRILVVGGGKAGAGMSAGLEDVLADHLSCIEGAVNVPAENVRPLRAIRLQAARPAGTNEPTTEGVAGTEAILRLVSSAGPEDIGICLLSGGGSALMPAPVPEVGLGDKQQATRCLHASAATIHEMNTVRKHLSRCKGGKLAAAFTGKVLYSLIISDVVGDPLEVIASGPTTNDPTTFADALAVLEKHGLQDKCPASVWRYLEEGRAGKHSETLKECPSSVHNCVIGNNRKALLAAQDKARFLGYDVISLGSDVTGDTSLAAKDLARQVETLRSQREPRRQPRCILSGGETTVALKPGHGLGGRNQELALAFVLAIKADALAGLVLLSGGTDGEDGPTNAAGAFVDEDTRVRAKAAKLDPERFLERQDSYHFFQLLGDLMLTGLTGTNVMDLRVLLISD
jgi:hydroxypyruvate reductase/glycerate 2-kinase